MTRAPGLPAAGAHLTEIKDFRSTPRPPWASKDCDGDDAPTARTARNGARGGGAPEAAPRSRRGERMTLAHVSDFLHLVATVAWIGGMLFMKLVLMPGMEAIDPPQRGRLMGAVAKRFTIVAWTSTAVLLVTGVLKTPGEYLLDTGTAFGTLLLIKHVAIALMIVVGMIITFAVAPRLRALAPAPGQPPSAALAAVQGRLDALSAVNTVLGLVVLALVVGLRP